MINSIRAHLAEFGIVAPVGRNGVEELLYAIADQRDERIPEVARACLEALGTLLGKLKAQILEFDRQINTWHRSNETSRRLDELPSVGPALATALVASVVGVIHTTTTEWFHPVYPVRADASRFTALALLQP